MTIAVIIKNTNVSGYLKRDDLSLSGGKHNKASSKPYRVRVP